MDRTGSRNNIYISVSRIYQGRAWLDTDGLEAEGRGSYNAGLSLALATFKEVQADADIETIILSEQAFLVQEIAYCAPSDRKIRNSLTTAIQHFDEGLRALKVVEAGASYTAAEQTYSYRKNCRYMGMPKDAFHYACIGHIDRLDRILHSPGINLTEKSLLEQRISNLVTAQAVYVEKQKKALGLDV